MGMILRASMFAACMAMTAAWQQARAQSTEFYQGRDVRLLIGAGPGGTYGIYAQLAARHLRQFIPGQPNIVVQHMPGAGGLIGLNYSYSIAPKDGTLMHLVHAEVLYESLLTKDVKFNAREYQWIGRFADADSVVLTTRVSNARTLEDAIKREVTLGATGIANIYALAPLLLNRMSATKFKIIGGYKGASDVFIAMERGELDGAGMTLANALAQHSDKMKSGDLVAILAISAKRIPSLPDVPAMTEFGGGAEKSLLEIYASTGTIGRALAFPPGVPQERLQTMRDAFENMLADATFRTEVKKANILITPMSGPALASEVNRIMNTPPEQIAAARALHEELLRPK